MAYNNIYRSLEGEILRQTDKAVQFEICIGRGEAPEDYKSEWFPKSQLKLVWTNPDSNLCDIIMASEWIINQKGWMKLAGKAGEIPPQLTPPVPKKTLEEIENDPTPGDPIPNHFSDLDDSIPF